jgi:hypothetical protein
MAAATLPFDDDEAEITSGLIQLLEICQGELVDPCRLSSVRLGPSQQRSHVSLVHLLAGNGNTHALEALKPRFTIDINAESPEKGTPLSYACEACPPSRLEQTVNRLMEGGPNVLSLASDPLERLLSRSIPDAVLVKVGDKLASLYKSAGRSFEPLSKLLLKPEVLSVTAYKFLLSLKPNLSVVDEEKENLNAIEAAAVTLFPPFILHLMDSFRSRSISPAPLMTDRLWKSIDAKYKERLATTGDDDFRRNMNERVSEISRVLLQCGAPTASFPYLDNIKPIIRKFLPF